MRTVRTRDAATRLYPDERLLLGVSLLTMSQDGDTTEALLAQDLLHTWVDGCSWLRLVVQQDPWGATSSPTCKTLGGAWLLATHRALPSSII